MFYCLPFITLRIVPNCTNDQIFAFFEPMKIHSGVKITMASFVASLIVIACLQPSSAKENRQEAEVITEEVSYEDSLRAVFLKAPDYFANGFDFPVGKPDSKGYYNAQGFGKNDHLGDDWNGNGGGNTDMGDPIYAISDGLVTESVNYFGGWGNVTRVVHAWKRGDVIELRESLYAHGKELKVKRGNWVKRGQEIATIGNAEGVYLAHLHLEIRDSIGMNVGPGYSTNRNGYLDPTAFIKAHRTLK
jgi:murein DD-endopeptidase MepM/ murein hydrolase activator NlpD